MLPYRPALRFKEGEYTAAGRLQKDMQSHVRPYFIIPPLIERDPEKRRSLTPDEIAYVTAERIGKNWPVHTAYLDTQYIIPALRDDGLLRLFQVARVRNRKLIAVIPAKDLSNPTWQQLTQPTFPRIAIHLPFGELDADTLLSGLQFLGLQAEDCEIFIDFTGAELDPTIAAEVVSGTLNTLAEIAHWGCIIFQGSNYPTTNPAAADSVYEVPRYEWNLFNRLLKDSGIPASRLGFSDFGADCGHINFPKKPGGGKPIPHIRYTTQSSTVVVRGADTGRQRDNIRGVMAKLTARSDFSGRDYSYADRRMWDVAHGFASTGSPTMWREWNMAHHMTRIVRDLGILAKIEFSSREEAKPDTQLELFELKS